ncbi:hypothetical protein V1389_01385 [Flavobacterium rakeshii]|uniref:hypothetical protein n=1 Tax=Flavobacterium rakeshii TaxID=1038845 RepID=UPI002E7B3751|nr:hypothetical protein [Flavobacterium rakeshii]MEE1896969.1 hypothetical protein [Flavobacterium rakeshii]
MPDKTIITFKKECERIFVLYKDKAYNETSLRYKDGDIKIEDVDTMRAIYSMFIYKITVTVDQVSLRYPDLEKDFRKICRDLTESFNDIVRELIERI